MFLAVNAIRSYLMRMWIARAVESRLKRLAKTRPVIVLTGALQTGKTSTLRHLFPNYEFVSLDLPTEAEQTEKEPSCGMGLFIVGVIIARIATKHDVEILRVLFNSGKFRRRYDPLQQDMTDIRIARSDGQG
jgi:hypothetical protein